VARTFVLLSTILLPIKLHLLPVATSDVRDTFVKACDAQPLQHALRGLTTNVRAVAEGP
jgi:hypothetical protein